MFTPYTVRGVTLKNRVVVSPMAQYSAIDGMAGDYHLVHLGARALGGAGLVFAEMTCVSPDARITPGCPGLWNDAQHDALGSASSISCMRTATRRSRSRSAMPVRKGSTRVAWEGIDEPLAEGNWPLVSASRAAVSGRCQPDAAGDDPRRHGSRSPTISRAADPARRRGRLRLARTALRARLPAVELHLAADQPARRRLWRIAGKPTALSAGSLRRGARGVAAATGRCRCASRHTTGSMAASRPTTRSRSPSLQGSRRRPDRLFVGPGQCAARSRSMAACTRRRSPTASATKSASRPSRSARSARPTMSTASSPPAAPTCARWRGRIWPTRRGRCTRPRRSATPRSLAEAIRVGQDPDGNAVRTRESSGGNASSEGTSLNEARRKTRDHAAARRPEHRAGSAPVQRRPPFAASVAAPAGLHAPTSKRRSASACVRCSA